jgi:beta-1,4-mannosyltransferase
VTDPGTVLIAKRPAEDFDWFVPSADTEPTILLPAQDPAGTAPLPIGRWEPDTARPGRHPAWHRTRHRATVIALVTGITWVLYTIQHQLWPHSPVPATDLGWAWASLGVLWAAAFIPSVCEVAGLLMWRPPRAQPQPVARLVCWRIVSRGLNIEALRDTIEEVRLQMKITPLFPYTIEVVIDTGTTGKGLPEPADDLLYLRVPKDYRTASGTRNKARALNFALWASPVPANAWILHLDEESRPTPSGITGIAAAIREEEASGRLRIGQGTITYHRDWASHPFFTLADCIRTGSDLGRLFLSMKIGVPLFGLHGSFILVRNDVEQSLGFDIGPEGSLTEDAWWGTIAMDRGYRCRWVEGHIAEQCTFSVKDFIKQRRRWFNGMARTSLHAPVSWKWRSVLGISMITWASAPIAWVYTIAHFVDGGYCPPVIRAMANISLAVYITTTIIGLSVNMEEHGIWNPLLKLRWLATWIFCLPVFSLMEAASVAYAIVRPAKAFDVVKK